MDYSDQTQLKESLNSPSQSLSQNDLEEYGEPCTMNTALEKLGGFGLFQLLTILISIIGSNAASFVIIILAFLVLEPTYQCELEPNSFQDCTHEQVASNKSMTFIIDWESNTSLVNWASILNLHDQPPSKVSLIGSSFFLGWIIFTIFVPRLADLYGRLRITQISLFFQVIGMIGCLNVKSLDALLIYCFILGAISPGTSFVGFLYANEFVQDSLKTIVTIILSFIWSLVLFIAVFYLMFVSKHADGLILFGTIIGILSLIGSILLPESPRFLASYKRFDEVNESLRFVAWMNRVPEFKGKLKLEVINVHEPKQGIRYEHENETFVVEGKVSELCKIRYFRSNTIALTCIWTVCSFNYYVLTFYLSSAQGDIYKNTLYSATSEALGYFLACVVMVKISLRISYTLFFFISFMGSFSYLVFADSFPEYIPMMMLLARLGICANFTLVYFAGSVFYPPIISATAMACSNFIARFITIFSSFIAGSQDPIPMLTCSGLCFIACIASTSLSANMPIWT